MTQLDRLLATSFRAARWVESNGEPVCPECFDGDALLVDKEPRLAHPGLHSYRCRDCNCRFSDVSGTPLRGTTSPLRSWALALLTVHGDPTAITGTGRTTRYTRLEFGVSRAQLRRMREVWRGSQTLREAWTARLRVNGITIEWLSRTRRAA